MGPVSRHRTLPWVSAAALAAVACFDGDLRTFEEATANAETTTGSSGASSGGSGTTATSDSGSETGGASVGGSGTGGTGGGSGTGGETSSPTTSGSGGTASAPLLVDDFEDEDTLASNGFGWWYAQNDTAGDQTLTISAVSDRPGSSYAAHTVGVGFDIWGALVGLDFTPGDGTYDASAFDQIRFWAKASPDSVTQVSAHLIESDRQYGVELELTTDWQEYALVFDELPAVDGDPGRIDTTNLAAFQVFVLSGERFDVWIDDVVLDTL